MSKQEPSPCFLINKVQFLCADIQGSFIQGCVVIRSTLENNFSILEEKLDK